MVKIKFVSSPAREGRCKHWYQAQEQIYSPSDAKLGMSFISSSWFMGYSIRTTFLPTNTGCSKQKTV